MFIAEEYDPHRASLANRTGQERFAKIELAKNEVASVPLRKRASRKWTARNIFRHPVPRHIADI